MIGAKLKAYGIGFPIMGQTEANFWQLPGKERMVLVAAHLCDVVKIRETGWNRGKWVERILRSIGLGPGHAWCAAFVSLCAELSEFKIGPAKGRGRVYEWWRWARGDNRLGFAAQRGDLVFRLDEKTRTGHIGIITSVAGDIVQTIEGNTNAAGLREGDGTYRKQRRLSSEWRVIRI